MKAKRWLIITCVMVALWPVIVHADIERISSAYPWFILVALNWVGMLFCHENHL